MLANFRQELARAIGLRHIVITPRRLRDLLLSVQRIGRDSNDRDRSQRGPSARRFPPPWSVQELEACFIVTDSAGQKLAYVYFEDESGRRSAAKLLTKDEARWSATNGEVDAYGSNCNVTLTARHRLKPSSNAKSHEGSITAWLRSSRRGGPTFAQDAVR